MGEPIGPRASRIQVVPRPGSSSARPSGRPGVRNGVDPGNEGDIGVKPSGFDRDDLDLEDSTRSFEVNDVADLGAHESDAKR